MSLYRVKQFTWAIISNFKPIDKEIVNKYLNTREKELFYKLRHSDQHHCVRVCKDSLTMLDEKNIKLNKNKVAKVALLHDIGKTVMHLNTIQKSIIVILDKITKGKIKKYKSNKYINIYYNHPNEGLNILEDYNYDDEFLDVIRYHHNKHKNHESELLMLISVCDDKN